MKLIHILCKGYVLISKHTVDGRNPAPVDMVNISLFLPSTVALSRLRWKSINLKAILLQFAHFETQPIDSYWQNASGIRRSPVSYIYICTSDNTCSFSDTVPASLHSHLWFEGFGYRHIRYRIAVSTWEALEP